MHHILHHCDSKNPYTGDKCTVNNAVTCDFRSLWQGGRRRSNVCLSTLAVKRECNQISILYIYIYNLIHIRIVIHKEEDFLTWDGRINGPFI